MAIPKVRSVVGCIPRPWFVATSAYDRRMTRTVTKDEITELDEDDKARIGALLRSIGGRDVVWGAASVLEVWMTEQRMRAEREASTRLTRATWALAAVTCVLAAATVALVVATARLA